MDYDLDPSRRSTLGEQAQNTFDIVQNVITLTPISWQHCRASLVHMEKELSADDLAVLAPCHQDLRDVFLYMQQPCARTFLHRVAHPRSDMREELESYEALLDTTRAHRRKRLLVHGAFHNQWGLSAFPLKLFQAGDEEVIFSTSWTLSRRSTTVFFHTVSLEITINQHWGDASKDSVREFWLRGVRERAVVGALAGPPVRVGHRHAARLVLTLIECVPCIIRDRDIHYGAWHRWLCETWTTCSRGTCAIAFHHRALDHLAIAALSGAFSKKPTGLLLLNIPEMTPHLGCWQVTADGNRPISRWNLAHELAQRDPPSLCAGLAEGFFHTLH